MSKREDTVYKFVDGVVKRCLTTPSRDKNQHVASDAFYLNDPYNVERLSDELTPSVCAHLLSNSEEVLTRWMSAHIDAQTLEVLSALEAAVLTWERESRCSAFVRAKFVAWIQYQRGLHKILAVAEPAFTVHELLALQRSFGLLDKQGDFGMFPTHAKKRADGLYDILTGAARVQHGAAHEREDPGGAPRAAPAQTNQEVDHEHRQSPSTQSTILEELPLYGSIAYVNGTLPHLRKLAEICHRDGLASVRDRTVPLIWNDASELPTNMLVLQVDTHVTTGEVRVREISVNAQELHDIVNTYGSRKFQWKSCPVEHRFKPVERYGLVETLPAGYCVRNWLALTRSDVLKHSTADREALRRGNESQTTTKQNKKTTGKRSRKERSAEHEEESC